ncbi:hypothetical protein D3C76_1104600 [compost metagenome]
MLPHIQTKDRCVAVHQRAVLVATAFDHQRLGRRHAEPCPATTEARQCCFGERLLECTEAAQLLENGLADFANRFAAPSRRHDLPEQRMVGMTASLVDHRRTQGLGKRLDAGDQFFDRPLDKLSPLQRRVEVVDVSLVVLAVVNLHGLGIDVRFQRIVGVRQCRQGIRHSQWIPY